MVGVNVSRLGRQGESTHGREPSHRGVGLEQLKQHPIDPLVDLPGDALEGVDRIVDRGHGGVTEAGHMGLLAGLDQAQLEGQIAPVIHGGPVTGRYDHRLIHGVQERAAFVTHRQQSVGLLGGCDHGLPFLMVPDLLDGDQAGGVAEHGDHRQADAGLVLAAEPARFDTVAGHHMGQGEVTVAVGGTPLQAAVHLLIGFLVVLGEVIQHQLIEQEGAH